MGNIIRLKTKQDDLVGALEELVARAKAGEIVSFAFAAECSDKNIATCWHNADVGTRQYLLSHMQVDINFEIVGINLDKLIE